MVTYRDVIEGLKFLVSVYGGVVRKPGLKELVNKALTDVISQYVKLSSGAWYGSGKITYVSVPPELEWCLREYNIGSIAISDGGAYSLVLELVGEEEGVESAELAFVELLSPRAPCMVEFVYFKSWGVYFGLKVSAGNWYETVDVFYNVGGGVEVYKEMIGIREFSKASKEFEDFLNKLVNHLSGFRVFAERYKDIVADAPLMILYP